MVRYKYRSCEDILEALKTVLPDNCTVTLSDEVKELGGIVYTEATATLHTEQGNISVTAQAGIDVNKKGMDVSQCFGTSSSYARKYALNGLFMIDDTKDADTNEHYQNASKAVKKPKKQPITDDRFAKALDAMKVGKTTKDYILNNFVLTDSQKKQL